MRLVLSIAAAAALAGCVTDDGSISDQSQNVETFNRLAANRLAANRLAANRLAANRLAANHLNGVMALNSDAASELLATPDGRQVLTYIVSCALPEGESLTANDGTVFVGEIGVAPQWIDRPLDEQGQRWLSACLFARVSDLDVAVPISLRGHNSGLTLSPGEAQEFTIQQGAFYGNLFTPASQDIEWAACSGTDVDEAYANQRICATQDPANPGFTLCGFIYTGQCESQHSHHRFSDGACARFDSKDTYYDECRLDRHRDAHHGGHDWGWHWEQTFDEVITVYVEPGT